MEFESRAVEVFDLGMNLVNRHRILYDQMSYKVKEHESTSSRAESYMMTGLLQLQASAHWTLNPVNFIVVKGVLTISNLRVV